MSAKAKTLNKKKYSKFLSSLFCSIMILNLSALCLLNNLSIDLYSTMNLLMVVVSGAVCFWILGFTIGFILDNSKGVIVKKKIADDTKAYEFPSMFAMDSSGTSDLDDIF